MNILVKQQQRRGLVAYVETKRWGREGEFDLCIEYKNFNAAYKAEQQFLSVVSTPRSPTTVERILNCGGARPVDGTRR